MIDEMLIVQLLARMITIIVIILIIMVMKTIKLMVVQMLMDEEVALVTSDNGDIVDFEDEAGGTRETKC